MRIKKTPNYKKVKKDINKKVYKALETSGTSTILALKKRIKKGVDAKGGKFKSLNAKYKGIKSKLGKKAMFEFNGDMLRSITHKGDQNKNSLKLYFDDGNENNKAYYNTYINKRDFFELSDKEIKKIEDRISDSLINV